MKQVIPDAEATTFQRLGNDHKITNRHRSHEVDGICRHRGGLEMEKREADGFMLRELPGDRIASIQGPPHRRLADHGCGYRSLAMAASADRKARLPRRN